MLHMKEKLSDDATSNDDLMRASDLRDQWRRRDFYVESTDKVYRKWRPRLEEMYKDRVDWKDVGERDIEWRIEHLILVTCALPHEQECLSTCRLLRAQSIAPMRTRRMMLDSFVR